MELVDYLKERHVESTVKRYTRELDIFFSSVENPQRASYNQIMEYLGEVRKTQKNPSPALHAIKKYYSYLVATGKRKDHPAKSIRLRDRKGKEIQLQELFSKAELEKLLDRKERYPILKNRNKIIIGLLIYQALTNGEIKNLTVNDLDLENGTVNIKTTRKTNARTLKLRPNQVFWLMCYLQNDRPKLLKTESEKLIISKLGTEENGEGIGYVIETCRPLFPDRNLNAKIIRQSVIANLLKEGKDLRLAQAFAGHKYPSTTERYRQSRTEELKNQILKYHPLG